MQQPTRRVSGQKVHQSILAVRPEKLESQHETNFTTQLPSIGFLNQALLTGLQPNTTYYYITGSVDFREPWSEVYSFTYLPARVGGPIAAIYADFGFERVTIGFSTRPEVRAGSDEVWDRAEAALAAAAERAWLGYRLQPGQGAFYGPKIEYTLKDAIGRPWQCGTIQVDFSMPLRLEAEYVAEDNTRKVPVMLHRAILGSLERFIGMLIENHAGALPLWLAPVQVSILNISEGQSDYAKEIEQSLKKQGFRVQADLRNEKITYKIREHSVQKLPYIVVVGDKERDAKTVAVRARGNVDLGVMPLDDLVQRLQQEIATKA